LSKAIEKCEQLVVWSIASGLAVGRYDGIENPLLQLKAGVQVHLGRLKMTRQRASGTADECSGAL
jgi:hypothetical protein